jgi:hypothetical protein
MITTSRNISRLVCALGFFVMTAFALARAENRTSVLGTVVRFTAGSASVDVTIGEDNPTVRDFLSLLPLTMKLEEFAGREKIGYISRKLMVKGSKGSDPEDGDLIYFVPWGNLGFYYNASGIGYSDQTIHIGKYRATPAELARFDGQTVIVEIVK